MSIFTKLKQDDGVSIETYADNVATRCAEFVAYREEQLEYIEDQLIHLARAKNILNTTV